VDTGAGDKRECVRDEEGGNHGASSAASVAGYSLFLSSHVCGTRGEIVYSI
jgi:hypothetical protein